MSKLNFFSSSEYITCTESIINNKKVPEINCNRNYATNLNKHGTRRFYFAEQEKIETCNYNYISQVRLRENQIVVRR
jgi:hypothetical protein